MRRLAEAVGLLEDAPRFALDHGIAPSNRRSASLETGSLGRAALESLVELKTSVDTLALAKAQAHKLQHTAVVSNLRALEAQNVMKYLRDNADGAVGGQMATGPGFGLGEAPKSSSPSLGGIANQARSSYGFAGNLVSGGAASESSTATPSARKGEEPIDNDSLQIKDDIGDVVELTRKVRYNSTRLAEFIGMASDKADSALRDAAYELNFPGFPQPSVPRPAALRTAPRPADLAPTWLDFLHSSATLGTDPYPPLPHDERDAFGLSPGVGMGSASTPDAELARNVGKMGGAAAAGKALAGGQPVHLGGLLKGLA